MRVQQACTFGMQYRIQHTPHSMLMHTMATIMLWHRTGVVKRYTGEPSDAFIGVQAVYRISLGNFVRSADHHCTV